MKLLATCNCLQQVEREIPAEIQVQGKILTSQDGRKYACTGNIGSLLRNERLQGRELPYSCYGATLWNFVVGISLSYACGLEHVGVKPSQQGRALISHLLDTPSVMAWEEGCVFQSLIGRWYMLGKSLVEPDRGCGGVPSVGDLHSIGYSMWYFLEKII